jgi:transposase
MAKPLVTDELWAAVEPLLLPDRPKPKGGRPRASDRAALAGIILVLRTGIPWEYVPREMGVCGMTCWRRLRDWQAAGVWAALHRLLLERLQAANKLNWARASLDSASVPAKGGDRRPARTRRIAASRARSVTSSSMAKARPSA